jgi:glycosyltransferase involved in cell wall biosynthesis
MRILTFTNLYPSSAQPRHGIFIEQRVRRLVETGEASVRVVAPKPWAPKFARRLFGHFASLADVPAFEERHDVAVRHPRFFAVPKVTSWLNPFLMALGALPTVQRLQREEDFDLIDAHFVYPDGAAAIFLGAWLGKPVTVTARGTDINEFPQYRVPRAWIRWVLSHADALITVSTALRDAMLKLGAAPERISVLRNGVDLSLFSPAGREAARAELNLRSPTLLSVGHLIPDKGHHFVIEALARLPGVQLVIVGEGPMRSDLQAMAKRLGVAERIIWRGTLPQQQLARHYAAADATVLASRLEGMPNVLLESIACGSPVIATNVGGAGEVVSSPAAGVLMKERSAASVVDAWRELERIGPDRVAVRRHAEQFGWAPTTQGLLQLFSQVLARAGASHAHGASTAELR